MRIIELSNRPEVLLREEQARCEDEYKARLAEQEAKTAQLFVEYGVALREHHRRIATLERETRRLRSTGRLFRALRTWPELRRARSSPPPDPPATPQPLAPPEPTIRELPVPPASRRSGRSPRS